MEIGAFTQYIDAAQIALYLFWIFFAGLLYYLHREDKREGYPLESEGSRPRTRVRIEGFPAMPRPKTYRLAHGGTLTTPRAPGNEPVPNAAPVAGWTGAPLQPGGDAMLSGAGPAAYANRAEHPDPGLDGRPKIVPMRVAHDFSVDARDPDPRGMAVIGADGVVGGRVADIWVDRSEPQIRYLEVEAGIVAAPTDASGGAVSNAAVARRVLVPIALCSIKRVRRRVVVQSVLGRQFANAPRLAQPDQVTMREEDRTSAYFASGNLFATPERAEPLM